MNVLVSGGTNITFYNVIAKYHTNWLLIRKVLDEAQCVGYPALAFLISIIQVF